MPGEGTTWQRQGREEEGWKWEIILPIVLV